MCLHLTFVLFQYESVCLKRVIEKGAETLSTLENLTALAVGQYEACDLFVERKVVIAVEGGEHAWDLRYAKLLTVPSSFYYILLPL